MANTPDASAASSPEQSLEHRRKRLLFRANHRGMKETDRMLGDFATAHLHELDSEALAAFEALMDEADADLLNWLTGKEPIPEAHQTPLMERILAFKNAM